MSRTSRSSPDLVVIGGGVVGLWCALKALRAGLSTLVVEKRRLAQGASGGFLGALMPHQPVRWTSEKAFQLDALLSLETEIARLEGETGHACGYLRCGRLIPTATQTKRAERNGMRAAAGKCWPDLTLAGTRVRWNILDRPPDATWLAPRAAPFGCELETLSARLSPRALMAALAAAVREEGGEIAERTALLRLDPTPRLELSDGRRIAPGQVVVSAGHESFDLLAPVVGARIGRGVKGQAALLKPLAYVDPTQPILYAGGLYVIAHESGHVAVGSTSEKVYDDPVGTDAELDGLIDRASALCPSLAGAEIVERWAGVRPNAAGRHPLIGPLPQSPRIVVCTGGFKISFGIAHKMADAALAFVAGRAAQMPDSFSVAAHLEAARRQSAERA